MVLSWLMPYFVSARRSYRGRMAKRQRSYDREDVPSTLTFCYGWCRSDRSSFSRPRGSGPPGRNFMIAGSSGHIAAKTARDHAPVPGARCPVPRWRAGAVPEAGDPASFGEVLEPVSCHEIDLDISSN